MVQWSVYVPAFSVLQTGAWLNGISDALEMWCAIFLWWEGRASVKMISSFHIHAWTNIATFSSRRRPYGLGTIKFVLIL